MRLMKTTYVSVKIPRYSFVKLLCNAETGVRRKMGLIDRSSYNVAPGAAMFGLDMEC